MIGKTYSAVITGTVAHPVVVETDISAGIPSFDLTGNLGGTVKEAAKRVRTGLKNSGFHMQPARVTVNIAPANIRKEGPHLDLAVAMSVLCAMGVVDANSLDGIMFAGEVALDGQINSVRAILPITICARSEGFHTVVVANDNASEGAVVEGIDVIGVDSILQCVDYVMGRLPIDATKQVIGNRQIEVGDYIDIKGQRILKRAIMIAAASMHNMLILGPPGAGKSMAAEKLPGILPPLSFDERVEISKIYSVSGLLSKDEALISSRPFRRPHYTITRAAFSGGGHSAMPGEMSLAQMGVLFLDEINLFSRHVLETLRLPLESGKIRVDRCGQECEYPADFMLVGAMNPCQCGFYPDRTKCKCQSMDIDRHIGRISKPIMDRIDICVNAQRVTYEEINAKQDKEYDSEYMRQKVLQAFNVQQDRYKGEHFSLNSRIPTGKISKYCRLEKSAAAILEKMYELHSMSVRTYNKILKVGRTIADIEGHEFITASDISEALSYKMLEAVNE